MPNDTAEKQRAHVARRRAKKQCVYCSSPIVSGRTMCSKHLEVTRAKLKKQTKHRKIHSKCTRCGRDLDIDADSERLSCINCREEVIMPTQVRLRARSKNAAIPN